MTDAKACAKCGEPQPLDAFPADRSRPDGRHPWCLKCRRAAARSRYQANPEAARRLQRDRSRRHWLANTEEIADRKRADRRENPGKVRAWGRRWDQANREVKAASARQRNLRNRAIVFARYGEACACCGSTRRLTIDHVNGDGRQHRKEPGARNIYRWLIRNDFPEGFQTLCQPCNTSKGGGDACRLDHRKSNGHHDGDDAGESP